MESSGISVILPNMIEFIPMLIAFIIVAIVLWKFGWPKFEGMLETRKNKIEEDLKESEAKRVEAEKLLEEYKTRLKDAEAHADEILKEAKAQGVEVGKSLREEAKKQADAATEKAAQTIEQRKKAAEHEIKMQAVEVAVTAMRKFLSNDLSDDEHRKIIEKYVNDAGSLKA